MNIEGIEIADINEIPPMEIVDQKEVYAFFGLASYNSQCLEKGLVNFAMAYKALDESSLTQQEWLSLYDGLNSKTFGALLRSVKSRIDIPEVIHLHLDKSLKKRNWLAHDFFYDKAMYFSDNDGMKSMISELQELIYLFQVTDRLIDTIYMKVWASFGVTEEWIEKEIEAQLKEYRNSKST